MIFNIGLVLFVLFTLFIFLMIYKASTFELGASQFFLERYGIKIEQNNDTSLTYKYNILPTPIKSYKFKLLGENIHKVKEAIFEGDSVYFIKLYDDSYFFKLNGVWHLHSEENDEFRIYNPLLLKSIEDIEKHLMDNCKKEENLFYDPTEPIKDKEYEIIKPKTTMVFKNKRGPAQTVNLLKFKSKPIIRYHNFYGSINILKEEGIRTYKWDKNNGLWYDPELVFIHGRKTPECYLSKEDSNILNQTLEKTV